jgi:hypothetical protein
MYSTSHPPYLGWDIWCPTHTKGSDLGFAWHIKCTSKQIYAISKLTTELCPSFLPQGIEKQFFSDLPLLLQWREYNFIYQELHKKGLILEVPDTIIPENHSGAESLHSFAVAILCKAQDLLSLRFIGVPKINQFQQEFLDYYCYHRGISPRLRAEGTWTSTEVKITELPINPTFAAKADTEFIEPVANYFPPVPDPPTCLPGDSDSGTSFSMNLKRVKSSIDHVIFTNNIRSIDQGQSKGGSRLCHQKGIQIRASRHTPNS